MARRLSRRLAGSTFRRAPNIFCHGDKEATDLEPPIGLLCFFRFSVLKDVIKRPRPAIYTNLRELMDAGIRGYLCVFVGRTKARILECSVGFQISRKDVEARRSAQSNVADPNIAGSSLKPARRSLRQAPLNPRQVNPVRQWIFVYFFLLIFEGVFRKWVFGGIPSISLPLVIIRDPVAVIIYYFAWKAKVIPKNVRSISLLGLSAFSLLGALQVLANPGLNFLVVLYGIRTYWLHVPLIFIIAEALDREDLLYRPLVLTACPSDGIADGGPIPRALR